MNFTFWRSLLFCAAFISTGLAQNSSSRSRLAEELPSFIEAELKRSAVPGCAVGIVSGENIIFVRGFGIANADTGQAVGPDMLFRLGSTTKMFTAATLVSLANKGKLKLDAPIGEYVAGLNPKFARLTSHQLLTHTAGLADETRMQGPHDESALGKALRARNGDLCFMEPGELWSYSNPGYWLAGLVIEEVSGKAFADAVHDEVLGPLGMKRSTFRPTVAMTWPLAIGHGPESSLSPAVVRPLADNAAGWPAGQLFSNAEEYGRFCLAFLNGGKLDGVEVLSPAVIEQLSRPHVATPGGQRHYGYGLGVEDEAGLRWLSHGGSRTGYGSFVRMCPEKKFAVIILCNKTGERLARVADKAIEIVLGIKPASRRRERTPLPSTETELQPYAGVYSNGETTIRLVVRAGKLVGPQGREFNRIGENRFLQPGAGESEAEVLFVPGKGGGVGYLCRNARVLKRVQ